MDWSKVDNVSGVSDEGTMKGNVELAWISNANIAGCLVMRKGTVEDWYRTQKEGH